MLLPAVAEVLDRVVEKLKQKREVEVKSELLKFTLFPETEVAVAEIPGQAEEPLGRLFVSVVQSEIFEEIVKSEGKSTEIEFSFPAPGDEGAAQTVPESIEFEPKLSSLTKSFVKEDALVEVGRKRKMTINKIRAIFFIIYFYFTLKLNIKSNIDKVG